MLADFDENTINDSDKSFEVVDTNQDQQENNEEFEDEKERICL